MFAAKRSAGVAPEVTLRIIMCNQRSTRIQVHVNRSPKQGFQIKYKYKYRSGTVNSKSFVGKVLLQIKRKFELIYAL